MISKSPTDGNQKNDQESARKIDPTVFRDAFLGSETHNGILKIRRWRNQWYYWDSGHYRTLDAEDVRCSIQTTIEIDYRQVTKSVVTNALDSVMAKCKLESTVEPHSYIENVDDRLAGETIVCFQDALADLQMLEMGNAIPATPAFFNINSVDFDFVPREKAGEPLNWLKFIDQVLPDPEDQRALRLEYRRIYPQFLVKFF